MRRIFTIALLLFAAFSMNAQVLATFENDGADDNLYIEGWAGRTSEVAIVANPSQSGLNTSANVVVGTTPEGVGGWWGRWIPLKMREPITITEDNRYLKMLVYRPAGQNVGFNVYWFIEESDKTEDIYSGTLSQEATWESLVMDLEGFIGRDLQDLRILIDQTWGEDVTDEPVRSIYIDQIELSNNPVPPGMDVISGEGLSIGFENEENYNYWIGDFDPIIEENGYSIIDNPFVDEVNTSSKVLEFNKSNAASWWQGMRFEFSGAMAVGGNTGLDYLHTMIYVPSDAFGDEFVLDMQLCAKDPSGAEQTFPSAVQVWDTQADTWIDLVLPLSRITYLSELTVRFDIRKNDEGDYINSPENTFYMDGILLDNNSEPRTILVDDETGGDGIATSVVESDVQVFGVNGAVAVNGAVDGKLEVFNTVGINVLSQAVSAGENTYAVPAGVYVVRFVAENGTVSTSKVLVK